MAADGAKQQEINILKFVIPTAEAAPRRDRCRILSMIE